jgi:hypothetical protein
MMPTKIETYEEGANNSRLKEPRREMKVTSGEFWLGSEANSYIRLGRDRYGGPQEGKGALAQGQCGAIDLFVGAGVSTDTSEDTAKYYNNPNFARDAARVYISQRCDIDTYFGITNGSELHGIPKNRSGIGIKADHVRLFARNHIKIVTGKAAAEGFGRTGAPNSLGGVSDGGGRIEFIVGNNVQPRSGGQAALQPVPLGDNLENFLIEVLDLISGLRSMVSNNTIYIQEIATGLCTHFHADTPQPLPGASIIDPGLIAKMLPTLGNSLSQNTIGKEINKFNQQVVNLNYLDPLAPEYILSEGVYTT